MDIVGWYGIDNQPELFGVSENGIYLPIIAVLVGKKIYM